MKFKQYKINVSACSTNQNPNLPPIRQDYGNGHKANGAYTTMSSKTAWYRKDNGAYSYYGITGVTANSDSGNGTGDWCPSNQYAWTETNLEAKEITAEIHNELKNKIILELQRRHRSTGTVANTAVVVGDYQTNERVKTLRDQLNAAASWSYPSVMQNSNMEDGDYIQAEAYQALRDRLNVMADDCVCNCNYCTCNCNYCTCNCNYACTCNCNYSDLNLKQDVEYAA